VKHLSISGVAVSGIAVIVYLLGGCNHTSQITDYSSLGLVSVCGHVFLDDVPLAAVDVIFESEDQTWSFATTDSLGWYQLQFNSEQNGVLPGPKTVRIRAHSASDGSSDDQSENPVVHDAVTDFPDHLPRKPQTAANQPGSQRSVVPTCYDRKSSLRVVVTTATRTVNLNLRSDCDGRVTPN
jgi:hypothetical protein